METAGTPRLISDAHAPGGDDQMGVRNQEYCSHRNSVHLDDEAEVKLRASSAVNHCY